MAKGGRRSPALKKKKTSPSVVKNAAVATPNDDSTPQKHVPTDASTQQTPIVTKEEIMVIPTVSIYEHSYRILMIIFIGLLSLLVGGWILLGSFLGLIFIGMLINHFIPTQSSFVFDLIAIFITSIIFLIMYLTT